jgi:hypothetical protein
MIDFVFDILVFPALVALVFLTLYLPSLIVSRLLFHFRCRKGPVMRLLSYPIGPSVPGRGADRSLLRPALKRWAIAGLKTVSLATALLAIGSGYALFGVAVDAWLEIAFLTVTFATVLAAVVSGVECVFLLVRLVLHRPRNPTDADAPEPRTTNQNLAPNMNTPAFARSASARSRRSLGGGGNRERSTWKREPPMIRTAHLEA